MSGRNSHNMGDIFHRQLDIFNPEDYDVPVHVIGVGATGSADVLALMKMGFFQVHAWDNDIVEVNNTAGQLYGLRDEDSPKVHALYDIVTRLADDGPFCHQKNWEGEPLSGIVVMGVDSMEVRRQIFDATVFKPQVQLVIDHRIGGQEAIIFCYSPTDADAVADYEQSLTADEDAARLPCTQRSVIDINFIVAGLTARAARTFLVDGQRAITHEMHYNARDCTFMRRQPGGAFETLR